MSRPSIPRRAAAPCPLCGKPALPAFTPFCSQGCRDRDLLAWLGDGYAIPGPPADHDENASDGLDRP
jgi:endogenous inhibitor of DNA gyrase (YacG/DUF329 family)